METEIIESVGFIGAGNMAFALAKGMKNRFSGIRIFFTDPVAERMELFKSEADGSGACACAEEVIACPTFRFIEEEEIIETDIYGKEQKIDRLFMPEMIFTLGNENILGISQAYYESLGGDFIKSGDCYESGDLRRLKDPQ